MKDWIEALQQVRQRGESAVLVTVVGVAGSTPRNAGTKMLVTAEHTFDTIGGGHLEYLATNMAREMLTDGESDPKMEHFPLGPRLGQCCGGSATVLLEPLAGCDFQIAVFGAGHVGRHLIPVLAGLPCQIRWIDNRPEIYPEAESPANVMRIPTDDPVAELEDLPANSWIIILTHNHQLDFELCEAALKRDDFAYLGLIGSDTKARRFCQRLAHREFSDDLIAKMRCPMGLPEVGGKRPMEVAISVAGELVALKNGSIQDNKKKRQGLRWKELQELLGSDAEAAETAAPAEDSPQH